MREGRSIVLLFDSTTSVKVRALRLPQFVGPYFLLGIAHLFRVMERDGEMNPAIRAVTNPIAIGGKLNLIAFVRVPDRFAGPIHLLCASSKEASKIAYLVFSLIPVPL